MKNLFNKNLWRELAVMATMLTGVFSFQSSVAQPFVVPTGSMIPSIMPGDRLLVLKSAYDLKVPFSNTVIAHLGQPKRGDVIVFIDPKDPNRFLIKRLIGVSGDKVVVSNGFVSVNGRPVQISAQDPHQLSAFDSTSPEYLYFKESLDKQTSYIVQRIPERFGFRSERLQFEVPAGHYFFMGDNRDDSSDSRYWGFVPRSFLKGKALIVWLSLDSEHSLIPRIRWNRFGTTL